MFPFQDVRRTLDERVDDLMARLTVPQKAAQLTDQTPAVPELCIGPYSWWNEALHGVASAGLATVFPQALGLAATFDDELINRVARAIGIEGRVKHQLAVAAGQAGEKFRGLNFYSPNINILRDPRWGRGQETYGEDPYLTGRMAIAYIRGLQGNESERLLTAATAKHFAVHSGPERGRHSFDARVSPRDLEDTFLPAFRRAVLEANVAAVMTAYNRVNGTPASCHPELLKRLRDDWGFEGQLVSDCDAVRHIWESHHAAGTLAEAYAAALSSGMTSILDFIYGADPGPILSALEQGLITEQHIDAALRRNLAIRFRLGMFDVNDEGCGYAALPAELLDSLQHQVLALEAADKSMVLLKNDGILPLDQQVRRLAVIGPLADSKRVLLGSYHGEPSCPITVRDAIRAEFPEAKVSYDPGTEFLLDASPVAPAALTTAAGLPGLTATFYATDEHRGESRHERVDRSIDYDGTPRTRPASVPPNRAVRWHGYLTPPQSGEYDLGIAGNSIRLYLDGRLLVDDTGPHAPRTTLARVALEANRRYRIDFELFPGIEQIAQLVWTPLHANPLETALAAVKRSDVVVAVLGLTAEVENEEVMNDIPGFEGGDRTALELPTAEECLLRAVIETGVPCVLVLMSGGPVTTRWAAEHANAIVQAWYPGQAGGRAVARVLSGRCNPGGRLPVTIYRGTDELPGFTDYSMAGRTYRYFDGDPLYEFGHGLSYSQFTYSNLLLARHTIMAGETIDLCVTVRNVGERDGDDVAQLYLAYPPERLAPRHALQGFVRVFIAAGDQRQLSFSLDARAMSTVDEAGHRAVHPGRYVVYVGGGQPGPSHTTVSAVFDIAGGPVDCPK